MTNLYSDEGLNEYCRRVFDGNILECISNECAATKTNKHDLQVCLKLE